LMVTMLLCNEKLLNRVFLYICTVWLCNRFILLPGRYWSIFHEVAFDATSICLAGFVAYEPDWVDYSV
jgi:hypothetical protein